MVPRSRSPRVTVIVIFLNEEQFLAEAVGSVLTQTFQDWELLLVDDGSTDASADIACRAVQAESRRVRYLCHPGRINRGMSASRNLGLAHAMGEFVGFLDADDVWLPSKLAEQVKVLERHPSASLVYGRTMIWHSWNTEDRRRDFFYELGVPPDQLYMPPRLFELLLRNEAQTPTTCNALMRRSLFDVVGGFEESFRGMFEDQAFFAKALLRAPAYVDGRVWAKYRQHPASCSAASVRAGGDHRARLRFLLWLSDHLQRERGIDPRVRPALRRELLRCRIACAESAVKRLIRSWRVA